MRRYFLLGICLLLPVLAWAATQPDLISQALVKKAHGDFKGAIADYTQAITGNPKDAKAYLGRATVLSLEGNYAGAIADDTKAIALDPKNPIAWTNRGNVRVSQSDLSGALADYTQAIKLDPHHVHAFINRGNVKNLQKKYAAAIEDYSTAIALDPKNANAYYNRGGAKRSLGDYTGAESDFTRVIELNPADVPAYLNRAVIEIAQRDWVDARMDLKKCETLVPLERQPYIRLYLWVCEVKEGSSADAANYELGISVKQVPKPFSETWPWEIARFLIGQENEETFLASAKTFQAKKDKGQEVQAYYYAGMKRVLAGNKAGAAKFFRLCIATGNPSIHEYILAQKKL